MRRGCGAIRTIAAGVLVAGRFAWRAWAAAIDACFALVLQFVAAGGWAFRYFIITIDGYVIIPPVIRIL